MSSEVYEKIVFKPPIELIPDEYEITEKIAVHTFTSNTVGEQQSAALFIDTLRGDAYKIEENNMHSLADENFKEILQNIKQDVVGASGLILFFSCYSKNDGIINVLDGEGFKDMPIQNVIKEFTAYACAGLKNKPKIFIFHVKSSSLMQTDSGQYGTTYDVTYDTPGEADILIVYKKTESKNVLDFTHKLCDGINEYGTVEDIVSLVTCLESSNDDTRPLVVSTFTKKFYFKPGDDRGHHFHINQQQENIRNYLDDMRNNLSNVKTTLASSSSTSKKKKESVSYTKQKDIRKTTGTRSSSNLPASATESDGGGSKHNPKTATKIGSRHQLASVTTSDGGTDTRSSRSRLTSTKSNVNSPDKSSTDAKPRWKY